MSKVDGIINSLEPFVHGLGKAVLRELREALAQPAGEADPVLFVSAEQLDGFEDPKFGDLIDASTSPCGRYIPARKTPGGKFTTPLYTTPQQSQPLTYEQDRAAFEVWMTARYKPGCAMLNKDSDGDYINVYTMSEWAGWRAASMCHHGIKGVTE